MGSLSLKNIHKSFGSVEVLTDINLEVEEGEFVIFVGPSGCGKSTLLRIIAGLLGPDVGSVKLCGYDTARDPEKAKPHLGVISHNAMVYPDLTVEENLRFFAALYGVKDVPENIDKLLAAKK